MVYQVTQVWPANGPWRIDPLSRLSQNRRCSQKEKLMNRHRFAVALLALGLGGAARAATLAVSISLAADTTTAIPGGSGTFVGFSPNGVPPNPCISFGNVAFYGAGSGGEQGIYALLGGALTRIADLNTAVPGVGGQDNRFILWQSNPFISGNNVTFLGAGANSQGVYVAVPNGPPQKVADL